MQEIDIILTNNSFKKYLLKIFTQDIDIQLDELLL